MKESTNIIESATTTINSIPELLNAIENVIQSPYGWIPLTLIMLWFVLNKDVLVFFRFFQEKEKKKLEEIEKYILDKDNVEPTSKSVFLDIRTSRYFKVATGILAEKKMRDSLIKLHDQTSSNISWTTIKRAYSLLYANQDNEIRVNEITRKQIIGKYYNTLVGWLFVFFSASMFLMMLVSASGGIKNFLFYFSVAVAFGAFALFAFSQNFPLYSAMRIKEEIDKISDSSNET